MHWQTPVHSQQLIASLHTTKCAIQLLEVAYHSFKNESFFIKKLLECHWLWTVKSKKSGSWYYRLILTLLSILHMLHLWLHFSSYIRPSEAKRENTMEPKHWNAWKMIRNKVWYTTEWSFLSASSASRPWKDLDNMDKHSQTTLTSFWFCLTTYPTLLTVSTLWKLTFLDYLPRHLFLKT